MTLAMSGQAENPGPSHNALLEMTCDGDYTLKSSSFAPGSEVLNIGFIVTDPEATYKVHVRSLSLETADGMVELPVDKTLDPSSGSANGLANGWMGAKIGSVIYGTEECGLVAANTPITWIGYRFALMIDGVEVPFTSITYNITVTGLDLN